MLAACFSIAVVVVAGLSKMPSIVYCFDNAFCCVFLLFALVLFCFLLLSLTFDFRHCWILIFAWDQLLGDNMTHT